MLRHLPADRIADMLENFELPADATIDDVIREFEASSPLIESLKRLDQCVDLLTKSVTLLDAEVASTMKGKASLICNLSFVFIQDLLIPC